MRHPISTTEWYQIEELNPDGTWSKLFPDPVRGRNMAIRRYTHTLNKRIDEAAAKLRIVEAEGMEP